MRNGFTLIQISILLTVASLVLVAVLPSSQAKLTASNITALRLNTILNALRGYEASTSRLPCPGDATLGTANANYGVPATNNGTGTSKNCGHGGTVNANYIDDTDNIAVGMVPVKVLGLPNDYALDNFGRTVNYAVDTSATVCGWTSNPLAGGITVTDNGTANSTVAALVSYGADGHGAVIPIAGTGSTGAAVRMNAGSTDTDQLTNAHVASNFAPTSVLTNFVKKAPTATFDDVVVYKNGGWVLGTLPASATTIASVTIPASANYQTGQSLSFTVNWTAPVTVNTTGGTPSLTLTIGASTRAATYASGSGTTALVFSYSPIVSGDITGSGISMAPAISLNGGQIQSGSYCVPLGFTAPPMGGVLINAAGLYVLDSSRNTVRFVVPGGNTILISGSSTATQTAGNVPMNTVTAAGVFSIASDTGGNLYLPNHSTYVVGEGLLSTGVYNIIAGVYNSAGYNGNGLPATSAQLNYPKGIAIDNGNNIYIVDSNASTVRKFSVGGSLNTIAGVNSVASYNANGSATSSDLNHPMSAAVDSSLNVYIADVGNYLIRKVTSGGTMSTVVGPASTAGTAEPAPTSPSLPANGDGGAGASASIGNPVYLAVDNTSTYLYISDTIGNEIRRLNLSTGTISAYINANQTQGYLDGALSTAQLNQPRAIAFDASGDLFIADTGNNVIREVVSGSTNTTTIAGANGTPGSTGDNGPSASATFFNIYGLATVR